MVENQNQHRNKSRNGKSTTKYFAKYRMVDGRAVEEYRNYPKGKPDVLKEIALNKNLSMEITTKAAFMLYRFFDHWFPERVLGKMLTEINEARPEIIPFPYLIDLYLYGSLLRAIGELLNFLVLIHLTQ